MYSLPRHLPGTTVVVAAVFWAFAAVCGAQEPAGSNTSQTVQADPAPTEPGAEVSARDAVTPARARNQDGTQPARGEATNARPSGQGTAAPTAAPILDPASSRLTFQALLTDGLGDPLPGNSVELTANIYDSVGNLIEGPIGPTVVAMSGGVVDTRIPVSAGSFDGNARELGITVTGNPELAPRIKLGAVPYAFRVDRVASAELDDVLELGTANANGALTLWSNGNNVQSIELDGNDHRINTWGAGGAERIRLWGPAWGEMLLFDGLGNNETVRLSAGPDLILPGSDYHESGGQLTLSTSAGVDSIFLGGASATLNTTGGFQVVSSIGSGATIFGMMAKTDGGAQVQLHDELGVVTFFGGASSAAGGFLQLYQRDGQTTIEIDGDANNNNGGGDIAIYQIDGQTGVYLDGDSNGAGLVNIRDATGSTRVQLDGQSTGTGGEISVYDDSQTETIEILGDEGAGGEGSSQIVLRSSAGADRIEIDADGGSGGRLRLYQNDGDGAIIMDGNSGANGAVGGGRMRVMNAAGTTRVYIDGNYLNTGLGRIRADIVRVQGGVDLAEPFVCKDKAAVRPGMVMSIDPSSPGRLMTATSAYDRKVAGVVSGAGGVRPGITLSQEGVMEGDHLVALTGRVYCWCDASTGSVRPGDMLTTSNTPGHAMKAIDHAKAQGAIIGKAMTSLKSGKGLVLVLVQPQ